MRLTTHGWRAAPAGVLLAAALLTGCTDSGRDSDTPGPGAAEVTVQSKGATEVKRVECGGAPVHMRVHDAPSRVTIDVTAVGEASGMAAYRIAEFTP
ncbi:hypothetical protein ACFWUT_31870 [Streptomyces cyaneofuscatus]|uniref:hypothetical protein n=1 Tax=Streptomyces cyaneofuscatus TaxID=66883 RepID=UPI0036680F9D